jgi:type IV pilus assembly protein PilE
MPIMNTGVALPYRRHDVGLRRRMGGMTLLELMAVIMVIGVLGMIALPSYRQYVMRAQRTEAKAALLQLATNQERFYLQNRQYGVDANLTALGFSGGLTERGTYTLSINAPDPVVGYTATATPRSGAAINMTTDADCTTFTIDSQGVRGATGADTTRCW